MQDIQDAEADSVRDLTQLVDAELDYHERCAQELRRVRQNWPGHPSTGHTHAPRPTFRSRSNTAQSITESLVRTSTFGASSSPPAQQPVRMPSIRPGNARMQSAPPAADGPVVRPTIGSRVNTATSNSSTFQGGATLDRERSRIGGGGGSGACTPTQATLRNPPLLRPVNRINTARAAHYDDDVFADRAADDDTASESGGGSPDWAGRSSAATSVGSLSRTSSNGLVAGGSVVGKKAPPPPPPSRAKKPAPPVPVRRGELGY